ncbi:hypothetical protein E2C01_016710 [Portunus trituberculatus]|uniref:Uncharacterized protein n=1 Tax=Portunus trituberculatus TaxID=210409 RepID=A0A5B7DPT0_PORTR|nr:hypothetical protein [Portunus trituberculatus]
MKQRMLYALRQVAFTKYIERWSPRLVEAARLRLTGTAVQRSNSYKSGKYIFMIIFVLKEENLDEAVKENENVQASVPLSLKHNLPTLQAPEMTQRRTGVDLQGRKRLPGKVSL